METERLVLRRYREDDLQDLFEYLSDPEMVKYEPQKPMDMEETKGNLPTWLAPVQARVIPVKTDDDGLNAYAKEIVDALEEAGVRVRP